MQMTLRPRTRPGMKVGTQMIRRIGNKKQLKDLLAQEYDHDTDDPFGELASVSQSIGKESPNDPVVIRCEAQLRVMAEQSVNHAVLTYTCGTRAGLIRLAQILKPAGTFEVQGEADEKADHRQTQ